MLSRILHSKEYCVLNRSKNGAHMSLKSLTICCNGTWSNYCIFMVPWVLNWSFLLIQVIMKLVHEYSSALIGVSRAAIFCWKPSSNSPIFGHTPPAILFLHYSALLYYKSHESQFHLYWLDVMFWVQAGTVLTLQEAGIAKEAGARFLLSPVAIQVCPSHMTLIMMCVKLTQEMITSIMKVNCASMLGFLV